MNKSEDPNVSYPLGSHDGSNERSYIAQKQLYELWLKEYPDLDCPISKPLAYIPIPGFCDGILVVDYDDRTSDYRLSKLDHLQQEQYIDKIDLRNFTTNLFKTIRIAHKQLSASFTNTAGSCLSKSNITLDGEIKDLETFRSPKLGDPPASRKEFLEDLRIAIENLIFLSNRFATAQYSVIDRLSSLLEIAYNSYILDFSKTIQNSDKFYEIAQNLLKSKTTIPSHSSPMGTSIIDASGQFLNELIF